MALLPALLCLGLFCGLTMAGGETDRAKARHFFLKGAIKEAEGDEDQAYEFYRKAYRSDSTYPDGAFAYGSQRFFLDHDTFDTREEKLRSLAMSRPLVDLYPGDTYNSLSYGYMAIMADSANEAVRVYNNLEKVRPNESLTQLHKASAYGVMMQGDSAINAIRKYERLEGMSLESSLQKVRYHLLMSDTVGAIEDMNLLVEQSPSNTAYILAKGRVLQMLQMPDSALECFLLAEKIDPEDGNVKNDLAQAYAAKGDSVSFDRLTYEALMSDNLDLDVKLAILEKYLHSIFSGGSDTKRSDRLFAKLSEQYPHEPKILSLEARYSAAKKDYDAAIEQISYAIDQDPQNMEYFHSLLTYYLVNEQPEKAVQTYEKRLSNAADADSLSTPGTLMLYASAAEQAGQFDKAENIYEKLLQGISPALHLADSVNLNAIRDLDYYSIYMASNFYEMAADMYYKINRVPEAFRSYENALALFPDNDLALNNYAYFMVEKGDVKPGSEEFERAREMSRKSNDLAEEKNPTYLDTYAWILFLDKDFSQAEEVQKKAIEIAEKEGDNIAEFYSHYGDILFMNDKPQEALEQWTKALELEPDNISLQKKVKQKTFFYE